MGENRPACRATTGRPGERRSETRELRRQRPGMLREGSGQPACNGRPARGEAAASSTGTMPQTRGTGQCAGRTPTRVSEGPKRETLQPLRIVSSGAAFGRARLNPSGLTPGRLFGEQGSILCSRSRIRGTGILQVSRHETLEKPETASIITRTTERMEGFRRGLGPTRTKSNAAT